MINEIKTPIYNQYLNVDIFNILPDFDTEKHIGKIIYVKKTNNYYFGIRFGWIGLGYGFIGSKGSRGSYGLIGNTGNTGNTGGIGGTGNTGGGNTSFQQIFKNKNDQLYVESLNETNTTFIDEFDWVLNHNLGTTDVFVKVFDLNNREIDIKNKIIKDENSLTILNFKGHIRGSIAIIKPLRSIEPSYHWLIFEENYSNYWSAHTNYNLIDIVNLEVKFYNINAEEIIPIHLNINKNDIEAKFNFSEQGYILIGIRPPFDEFEKEYSHLSLQTHCTYKQLIYKDSNEWEIFHTLREDNLNNLDISVDVFVYDPITMTPTLICLNSYIKNEIRQSEDWSIIVKGVPKYMLSDEECPVGIPSNQTECLNDRIKFIIKRNDNGICPDTIMFSTLNLPFNNEKLYDGIKATLNSLIISLNKLTPGKIKNIIKLDQIFNCELGYEPEDINIKYQFGDGLFKIEWIGCSNIADSLFHYDKYIKLDFRIEYDISIPKKLQVSGKTELEYKSEDYDFYLHDKEAKEFFNFYNAVSHTSFEEAKTIVVYFYQDIRTNKNTLHILCDDYLSGFNGNISLMIKGLPINYNILVKNDPGDYYQEENGNLIIRFAWDNTHNAGLVIENITPFDKIEIIASNYNNIIKWKVLSSIKSFEFDITEHIIFNYEPIQDLSYLPLYNIPQYEGCQTPESIPNEDSNCGYIPTQRNKYDLFTDYGFIPEIIDKNRLKIKFYRCFKNIYKVNWTPLIGGKVEINRTSEDCNICPTRTPYKEKDTREFQKNSAERIFTTPISIWFINHNLSSKDLYVVLYDLDNKLLDDDARIFIVYNTYNSLTVYFFKYNYENLDFDEVQDIKVKPLNIDVAYVKRTGIIKVYRKNKWFTSVNFSDIQDNLTSKFEYNHPINGGYGQIIDNEDVATWDINFNSPIYLNCFNESEEYITPSVVYPNLKNGYSVIFTEEADEPFTQQNLLQFYSGKTDVFDYSEVIGSNVKFDKFLPSNLLDQYLYVCKTPQQEWLVNHNFNTFNIEIMNIQDFNSNDYYQTSNQILNDGEFNLLLIDKNNIKLIFNKPQSGKLLLKKYKTLDYPNTKWTDQEYFVYKQEKKAYTWTIIHPLNSINVIINVVDWNNNKVLYDVEIVNESKIIISFYKEGTGILENQKIKIMMNGKAFIMYNEDVTYNKIVGEKLYINKYNEGNIEITFDGKNTVWKINYTLNSPSYSIRCYDINSKPVIPSEIIFNQEYFSIVFNDIEMPFGNCLIKEILSSNIISNNGEYIHIHNSTLVMDQRYIPIVTRDCYWCIRHNLDIKYPRIICLDQNNVVIIPSFIHYVNKSYLEVVFSEDANSPINYISGKAYIYREDIIKSIFNFEISGTGGTGGTGNAGAIGGTGVGSIGGTGGTGGSYKEEEITTGESGGTGSVGFPTNFNISILDAFSQISVSKLRVEVAYPNNFDRIIHFENIYNAPQTLPHTFHNLGETFIWDGINIPSSTINRHPFEYYWSENGSQIRIKFIDLKIGFVFPSIKFFDTAYYKFWSSSNSWKVGDDPSEFFGTGGSGGPDWSGKTSTGGTGIGFTNFLTYDDYINQNLDAKLNVDLEASSEEWVEGVYFDEFNEGHIDGIEHYFSTSGYYVWTSEDIPNNRIGWAWSPGKYKVHNLDFDISWSPRGEYGRRFCGTPYHRSVIGTVEKGALYYYFKGQKPWKYWPTVSGQKIYESAELVWSNKPIIIWTNNPIMEWSEGVIGANFPIDATYEDVAQFIRATHGIGYWFYTGGNPGRNVCDMYFCEEGDQCYHGWGPGWISADEATRLSGDRYHHIPAEEGHDWLVWTGAAGGTGSPISPNFERGWLWSPEWGCYVWANKPSSTGDYFYGEGFWTWTGGIGNPGEGKYEYIKTTDIGDHQDHRIIVFNDTRNDKNQPPEISGDMSRHGLIYDGDRWYDYGIIMGTHAGFVPDQWEGIDTLSSFNINTHVENENTIVFTFTHPRTGEDVNMWKQILNSPERFEIVCIYNYFK